MPSSTLPAPALPSSAKNVRRQPRRVPKKTKSAPRTVRSHSKSPIELIWQVNQAIGDFLSSSATKSDYQKLVRQIGISANMDRVVLVINDLLKQKYEWNSRSVPKVLDHPRFSDFFAKGSTQANWKKQLKSGRPIHLIYSRATRSQKLWLSALKVKQVWVFPLMVKNGWWAYLVFHTKSEAKTDLHQTQVLNICSQALAGAMDRRLTELDLKETVEFWKHEQSRVAAEISNTKKFQQAVAGVNDGVVILSPDKQIIYANPAWLKMTSRSSEQVLGKNLDDLFTPKSAVVYQQMWQQLAAQQAFVRDEVTLSLNQNQDLPVRVSASTIKNGDANNFVVILFEDITKRQALDRAKTEFISIASHQLNTPLSAIKWFIDLINQGKVGEFTPKQQDVLNNISGSTERMIALVRSLLNISRIESGRIMVQPRQIDLRNLINQVVAELTQDWSKMNQHVNINIDPNLPGTIMADGQLLRHVYLNLLTNANKYSPQGANVDVNVWLDKNEIMSSVKDYGMGIPEVEQSKVFNKFFRAPNVIREQADGSGLGLYLVKIIVESSGGRVWFTSQEGQGSEFFFSLPRTGMLPRQGQVTLDQQVTDVSS